MLRTNPDPRLAVLVVWEPIQPTDSEQAARRATGLLPDPRVRQFWASDLTVGQLFQQPLGLRSEPAWDVYLLYEPGARWDPDRPPPPPRSYMHQLWALPKARLLDGKRMGREVGELLSES